MDMDGLSYTSAVPSQVLRPADESSVAVSATFTITVTPRHPPKGAPLPVTLLAGAAAIGYAIAESVSWLVSTGIGCATNPGCSGAFGG